MRPDAGGVRFETRPGTGLVKSLARVTVTDDNGESLIEPTLPGPLPEGSPFAKVLAGNPYHEEARRREAERLAVETLERAGVPLCPLCQEYHPIGLKCTGARKCRHHGSRYICDECSPPMQREADLAAGLEHLDDLGPYCTHCGGSLRLDAMPCTGAHRQASTLLHERDEARAEHPQPDAVACDESCPCDGTGFVTGRDGGDYTCGFYVERIEAALARVESTERWGATVLGLRNEARDAHEAIELAIDEMRRGQWSLALAALQKVSKRYDD
jgi:hypothetical protein